MVRHRPFGMMVEMPNGEVGLLEPEYAEPVWRDTDGWYPDGTCLRVVVLGYTTPGPASPVPAQLRLASAPNIIEATRNP
ncbi:hypothetical protein [Embleya sp. NPDC020630]|uniref:hypothetical protein n=1 Tax=Embleya sp. NPDC020630 TaxID=3363979 RepID=UPI0037BDE6EB